MSEGDLKKQVAELAELVELLWRGFAQIESVRPSPRKEVEDAHKRAKVLVEALRDG